MVDDREEGKKALEKFLKHPDKDKILKHAREDSFFTKDNCDRCGASLKNGRIMSFFTEETICTEKCSAKEKKIRTTLREQGKNDGDYEGCGYIPTVQNAKAFILED